MREVTHTPIVPPPKLDGVHPLLQKLPPFGFSQRSLEDPATLLAYHKEIGTEVGGFALYGVSSHTTMKPWCLWFLREIWTLKSQSGPNQAKPYRMVLKG